MTPQYPFPIPARDAVQIELQIRQMRAAYLRALMTNALTRLRAQMTLPATLAPQT